MALLVEAFRAKLAEVESEYVHLHARYLDFESEVLSLRGKSSDAACLKPYTPRGCKSNNNGFIQKKDSECTDVPEEPRPTLLVTPRSPMSGVASYPRQTELLDLAQQLPPMVDSMADSAGDSEVASCNLSEYFSEEPYKPDVNPDILNSWQRFTSRLLSGVHSWQIDPIWDANLRIRKNNRAEQKVSSLSLIRVVDNFKRLEADDDVSPVRRAGSCFHGVLPPFHPNSLFKQIWDMLSLLLVLQDFLVLPLIVFGDGELDNSIEIKMVLALFWTVDIPVSCGTGYYTAEGYIEMHVSKIAMNYLRTQFFRDFSIVMIDWLFLGLDVQTRFSGFLRILVRGVRGIRLIRLAKGLSRLSVQTENIRTEYIMVALDVIKFLICVFFASHYIACCWYGISQIQIDYEWTPRSWAQTHLEGDNSDNMYYAYATSLHWALTQLIPASMEVVPENTIERAFACTVILMALVIFSSFVSSITEAMTYLHNINKEKRHQEAIMRKFLRERSISKDLCVQIWQFVKRHKLTESSLVRETDVPIFKQLPSYLRLELKHQQYVPVITGHPLFALLTESEMHFITILCNECFREVQVGVDVEAFAEEQEVSETAFIISGTLEYISREEPESTLIGTKEWVCELALWVNRFRLQGKLLGCDRGAEVLLLNSAGFRKSARKLSNNFEFLADYARYFVNSFLQLSKDHESAQASPQPQRSVRQSVVTSSLHKNIGRRMFYAVNVSRSRCELFNDPEMIDLILEEITVKHPLLGMAYRRVSKNSFVKASGLYPNSMSSLFSSASSMSWR